MAVSGQVGFEQQARRAYGQVKSWWRTVCEGWVGQGAFNGHLLRAGKASPDAFFLYSRA